MSRSFRIVRLRNVTIGYGDVTIVRALSLDLWSDQTSVILGPGGSGKSTLLRAVTRDRHARQSGMWTTGLLDVFERRRPLVLTQRPKRGPETLTSLLHAAWPSTADISARLAQLWRCAPEAARTLTTVMDVPLSTLPPGLARLVEFTSAMARPSRVLVLDEPDAAVDAEGRAWMTRKLNELRGHRTILVVTHHLAFARAIADFVILMVDGAVIESAETERFFRQPAHPRTQDYVRTGG